jgi:hypothetical protein
MEKPAYFLLLILQVVLVAHINSQLTSLVEGSDETSDAFEDLTFKNNDKTIYTSKSTTKTTVTEKSEEQRRLDISLTSIRGPIVLGEGKTLQMKCSFSDINEKLNSSQLKGQVSIILSKCLL